VTTDTQDDNDCALPERPRRRPRQPEYARQRTGDEARALQARGVRYGAAFRRRTAKVRARNVSRRTS
jgi:hypothetical protein